MVSTVGITDTIKMNLYLLN